ncbi:MAG: histidine triad nucleotide-binding protein [Candidatus Eisenbacteria sp.]|nr:histidine triad nucleotide-binding protein [Candidatus Eisenbacteria bacterium]
MEKDCLFCKIIAGEIPAEKVYEDERILGFKDIRPAAPFHALLIPKEHIPTFNDLGEAHDAMMGGLLRAAAAIARQEGLDEGYRLVGNCLKAAGQEVYHIHVHLLGGRGFNWPPG